MDTPKNVLFIAVDDLRPEINCFGKKKLHTPNLNKLASRSVQFNRAYCQVTICMPSRASLLSGVRPDETWRALIHQMCPNGEPSLPGYLKENGYNTISIGKVYHHNDDDGASWTRRYKDTFYEKEYTCDGYCSGYQLAENKKRIRNFSSRSQFGQEERRRNLPAICECADASDSDYPDGMIANRAIEILEDLSSAPEPFFLATGFYRPHLPWAVPQKYWDLYSRNDVDLADNPFLPEDGIQNSNLSDFLHYGDAEINSTYSDIGHYEGDGFPVLSEQKQRECVHAYWASVSFVDAQIGKVLDELERLNLLDDTVIVLWGDNGWHLGEHGLWSKVTSFEEATRVPLIVSAPGFTSDVQSDAMVELVDIYPTLCSLLGLQCPDHLEGLSFEPILEEPAKPWKKAVFSRIFDAETLRTGRYRFTRYAEATPEGDQRHRPNAGVCELFDHLTDPRENVNVARRPERRELVKKLDDQLSAGWRAVLPDICLGL